MLTTLPNRVSALFADPFQTVFRELDREFPVSATVGVWRKVAPLSMWEDGDSVCVQMDVPGIALADLEVYVENGKLTVRGERKAIERPSEPMHEERYFGQFERTIALSDWVDPQTVEATLTNGVLQLKLSKKPESRRHKIAIHHSNGSDSKRIETSA